MIAQLNKAYISSRKSKVLPRLLSYLFFEGRPATTKGRWFNPITFASLKLSSGKRISYLAESPVFITGTGRSGSTILGMILSIHREVGFLNEPKALWFLANNNDDLIGSYSDAKASYVMEGKDANPAIASFVKSVYSTFLSLSRTKKIVDKFPEMIFRIEYLNNIFKSPRFIFLYRNPWDTISSTALWSEKHKSNGQGEDWWGVNNRKWNLLVDQVAANDELLAPYIDEIRTFSKEEDKAAVEWILTMNHGLKMAETYPTQFLPVCYEELTSHPAKVLLDIASFCQLSADPVYLNFGIRTLKRSAAPNRVSIHAVLKQPVELISAKLGYNVYSPSMSVTE